MMFQAGDPVRFRVWERTGAKWLTGVVVDRNTSPTIAERYATGTGPQVCVRDAGGWVWLVPAASIELLKESGLGAQEVTT